MSAVDDVLQTALRLSSEERARLAHSLIASLDDAPADDGADDAWASEISRRVASPDTTAEEWSVVRERLLGSLTTKPSG